MNKELTDLKNGFNEKVNRLEEVRIQLKTEFTGIDSAIDEVIDYMYSWYTLAEIQMQPTVVNLWGLTGVGKTSLLLRIAKLLEIKDKAFRVDLGVKHGSNSFNSTINEVATMSNDEPVMIILDEFQHARTIRNTMTGKKEIDSGLQRQLWDLLDSGKIIQNKWKHIIIELVQYIRSMNMLVNRGVSVKNGHVTEEKELFENEMKELLLIESETEKSWAIPKSLHYGLLEYIPERYECESVEDLKDYLKTLDGQQTINFMEEVLLKAKQPTEVYFHKSIIFVVGNLDEAYEINKNLNADISADEFHETSLKITIPDVKTALQDRFRDEQIARLGNNHIIYPALNKKAYRQLIQMKLDAYFEMLENRYAVSWTYDATLIDKIYEEGVYPTQGARPVLTTIYQMVKSKTALIFQSLMQEEKQVSRISLSVVENQLVCQLFNLDTEIKTIAIPLQSKLGELRKPKDNESQAITAVHEAGHAVLIGHLLEEAPQMITATATDKSEGFVYNRSYEDFTSKKYLIHRTAVQLGGLLAEKYIFGEENITMGASLDIKNAYSMIDNAFKNAGMGNKIYHYALSSEEASPTFHQIKDVEKEITNVIDAAQELAENGLRKERNLLLQLAKRLQNTSKIERDEFIQLYNKYGAKSIDFERKSTFYRDRIAEALEADDNRAEIARHRAVVLNRGKSKSDILKDL
ncbi:AAA family ATPase [Brumimicrobium sp.]|uniref:AAA family ATPase n=1 Tax=Brumimicrobium sp. TaxID=2029867 RepID=UPI003A9470D2